MAKDMSKENTENKKKTYKTKPKSPIDWEKVERLLQAHCSGIEIASSIGISKECLYERATEDKGMQWHEYKAKHRSTGKALIRATQFMLAVKKKDKDMLKFLGKNYLDQSERAIIKTGEIGGITPAELASMSKSELLDLKRKNENSTTD